MKPYQLKIDRELAELAPTDAVPWIIAQPQPPILPLPRGKGGRGERGGKSERSNSHFHRSPPEEAFAHGRRFSSRLLLLLRTYVHTLRAESKE